jgi:hypothetical protein
LDFAQIGGAGQIDEQHSYQPLASLQPAAHRALGSAGICGQKRHDGDIGGWPDLTRKPHARRRANSGQGLRF